MRRVTYSMGASLDGYIVGPDGGFDWTVPDAEVFRFRIDEIREVGVHLMGRRAGRDDAVLEDRRRVPSLDDAELEWAALWKPLPKVVFSTTLSTVQGNARLASGGLGEEIGRLRAEPGDGDIAIGGATLAAEAAALGLFDEYRAMVYPVLVGGGISYFPRARAPSGSRTRRDPHLQLERRLPPLPSDALATSQAPRAYQLTGDQSVTYCADMDAVFRALADPTRRSLLDELFREDGQTLGALAERFSMTRFGVMKHLKVLEEAGLVVTRRRGREKLHFLNPVPIRLVHDRWVSKYAEPWAAALSDMKARLESPMEKVFEIYIKTTPERLWQAITDPEIRSKYNFGARQTTDWTPGSRYEMGAPGAQGPLGEGVNLEVDPPRRLVQSMVALWGEDVKAEGTSRVTWEIVPVGDSCHLTVTHDQLREGANEQLYGGWPMILSGLKTWLETGELLTTPGSLMYTGA